MEPKIIYEDRSLLIIDKPAGFIVNQAATVKGQKVLQEWLVNKDYLLAKSKEYRAGIVHRLDKETSGLIVVAKKKEAFEKLQLAFKERKVAKTYVALVHGKVEKEGKIEAPVGRLPWRRDRFGVLAGGRKATTNYKAVSFYKKDGETFSLIKVYPETGRTHQIRVHLKCLGHPIVSDSFYAGRRTAKKDRAFCPRLFLHASNLSFTHPETGRRVEFSSRLPLELEKTLGVLEKIANVP